MKIGRSSSGHSERIDWFVSDVPLGVVRNYPEWVVNRAHWSRSILQKLQIRGPITLFLHLDTGSGAWQYDQWHFVEYIRFEKRWYSKQADRKDNIFTKDVTLHSKSSFGLSLQPMNTRSGWPESTSVIGMTSNPEKSPRNNKQIK